MGNLKAQIDHFDLRSAAEAKENASNATKNTNTKKDDKKLPTSSSTVDTTNSKDDDDDDDMDF